MVTFAEIIRKSRKTIAIMKARKTQKPYCPPQTDVAAITAQAVFAASIEVSTATLEEFESHNLFD